MDEAEIRRIIEELLPKLRGSSYRITSPADPAYNCIAWSVRDTLQWWWPMASPPAGYHWPAGARVEETVPAFLQMFASLGYTTAVDDNLIPGIEKIALYAHGDRATHAARQTESGRWTSKLGKFVDIEHSLDGLCGTMYGAVVHLLQRTG